MSATKSKTQQTATDKSDVTPAYVSAKISELSKSLESARNLFQRLDHAGMTPGELTTELLNTMNLEADKLKELKYDANRYWYEANDLFMADPSKENRQKRNKISHIRADINEVLSLIDVERAKLMLRLNHDDKMADKMLDRLTGPKKDKWDFMGKIGWGTGALAAVLTLLSDKSLAQKISLYWLSSDLPGNQSVSITTGAITVAGIVIGMIPVVRDQYNKYRRNKTRKVLAKKYLQ